MASKNLKNSDIIENIVVLRSVYGKVGMKYILQPCKNPETGEYEKCVKPVDSLGNIILNDKERNSDNVWIKETDKFEVVDGTTFDLDKPRDKAIWDAIKYCPLIAPERWAKDKSGNYLIDGTMGWSNKRPRFGVAEIYVDRPGLEAQNRVSKKKMIHNACNFIYNDERGYEGRVVRAKMLGKRMDNMPDADVTDYLLEVAERDPDKIIALYNGDDMALRLLFIEAQDKNVILYKNRVYSFANVVLGATDEAVIQWMKMQENSKVVDLIRRETYPDYFSDKGEKK